MRAQFRRLFEPGMVGGMEMKNRIISAPHLTRLAGKNGGVTEGLIAYYRERARTGVALAVVEGSYVIKPYPARPFAGGEASIPGLRMLSDAIHEGGAKSAIQICIGRGRADEVDAVSSSDVPHPDPSQLHVVHKPRPLTKDEIAWLVEAYAEGCTNVRKAGFDALVIHACHVQLVTDFLSPRVNLRTDEYGGSLENRARLLIEMIRRTRQKVGMDYPVLVRLIGSDRVGTWNPEDAARVAKMLEAEGACMIDVTSGMAESQEWVIPTERIRRRACNVDASETVKKAVRIPVGVAGKIDDPYLAEQVLQEGKADYVSLARPLDADHDFIRKALEGRADEIRRCIGCARCNDFTLENRAPLRCSVNALAGREAEVQITPAARKRRILVVGGGPAGMEAARMAATRGHDVTLWEKSERLGGMVLTASLAPDKEILSRLPEYLSGQLSKLGVKVVLGKEATADEIVAFKPDAAIIAVGASPRLPNIPGADGNNVVLGTDVLAGKAQAGQRCVVLATDATGCEVAEYLADRGHDVTIVDPAKDVASELLGHTIYFSRIVLVRNLREKLVRMLTEHQAVAITGEGVLVRDARGKEKLLPADTIISAVGFDPRAELFNALDNRLKVYQIGDCAGPRHIMDAVHDGAEIGLEI